MNEELIIIINSCDAYSDLWEAQVTQLNKYWPNRPYTTILITDKPTEMVFENVLIYSVTDNRNFSGRLKETVLHFKANYYFIILDDYLLKKRTDSDIFNNLISNMIKNEVEYCRIYPVPFEKPYFISPNKLKKIDLKDDYAINLYPAIWSRDFLVTTFEDDLNAWQYEVSLTKVARIRNGKYFTTSGSEFRFHNAVVKGKFFRATPRFFEKESLVISDREVLKFGDAIKYRTKRVISIFSPKKLKNIAKPLLRYVGVEFLSDE